MKFNFTIPAVVLACLLMSVYPQRAHAEELLTATGKITMIRISGYDDQWGAEGRYLKGEVFFWMDTMPGKTFGYQFPNDANQMRAREVSELLRDAFAHNWKVTVEYWADVSDVNPDPKLGKLCRLMVTKR